MKGILFDMDGVLVDVTCSYRTAIKKTAEFFCGQTISYQTIDSYKSRGGLNNDWDLTEAILIDKGLSVAKDQIIRVFQQYYLGNSLQYDGLIQQEKWLLKSENLLPLTRPFPTGIVTGRPVKEALFTLKNYNMEDFFPVLVGMEDVPPGCGKPDPAGLRIAMAQLNIDGGWYIGDSVDDIAAAINAGLVPIGVAAESGSTQENLLREQGAEAVYVDVNAALQGIFSCDQFKSRSYRLQEDPYVSQR